MRILEFPNADFILYELWVHHPWKRVPALTLWSVDERIALF